MVISYYLLSIPYYLFPITQPPNRVSAIFHSSLFTKAKKPPLCQTRYRLMSVSYRKAKNVTPILHSSLKKATLPADIYIIQQMKIIIITTPEIRQGETEIINALFREGMHRLHLRKPKATASQLEEYINQIHPAYRNRIVLHDHHDLVRKMHLGGIHLNSRNPLPPAWLAEESQTHPITISRSCHSIAEASEQLPHSDYIFLSPIFDSISKEGYQSAYTTEELQQAATQGILSEKTYALGGISLTNLPTLRRLGFQGAAILGDLWSRPTPTILPHFLACLAESKK